MSDDPQTTPIKIAMVAPLGAGTGDGSPMPAASSRMLAQTPGAQPNLLVKVVTPITAIAIRYANAFLVSLSGLLAAQSIGVKIFSATEVHGVIVTAAWASFWVANMGLLKNLVTIVGGLEGKFPLSTGSI